MAYRPRPSFASQLLVLFGAGAGLDSALFPVHPRNHYGFLPRPLSIALWLWILGKTIYDLILSAHYAREKKSSTAWPVADAVIRGATIKRISFRRYAAVANYTFVTDSYYGSEFAREFKNKDEAQQFAEFVRGRHIPVHYKPADADVSFPDESGLSFTPMSTQNAVRSSQDSCLL